MIDEIKDCKLTKMDKETDIKNMEMWHVGFGRQHCHQLFKTTTDIMPKMDQKMKQENYKQCVIIFLITTYKILIDKKLINPEMLSEKYIRNHFNDNWTINNLVARSFNIIQIVRLLMAISMTMTF